MFTVIKLSKSVLQLEKNTSRKKKKKKITDSQTSDFIDFVHSGKNNLFFQIMIKYTGLNVLVTHKVVKKVK